MPGHRGVQQRKNVELDDSDIEELLAAKIFSPAAPLRQRQFSLTYLFFGTTLIAVVLGIGNFTIRHVGITTSSVIATFAALFAFGATVASLLSLYYAIHLQASGKHTRGVIARYRTYRAKRKTMYVPIFRYRVGNTVYEVDGEIGKSRKDYDIGEVVPVVYVATSPQLAVLNIKSMYVAATISIALAAAATLVTIIYMHRAAVGS
ncbi:MAG: hypothetical protein R3E01_04390 [Pirellulaceae bacterium]|nr:hypothetical protein [Planctomycetales bacterium]